MHISMKADIRQATKKLRGAQKKQIPFAVKNALNQTAKDVVNEEKRQMPRKLDRPTKFTIGGVAIQKGDWATKKKSVARVSIRPIQAAYLGLQVHGGSRRPKRRAIAVPVGVALNKHGNMTRGKIKSLLAKPNTFSGTINGVGGIWERGHTTKSGTWSTAEKSRSTNLRLLVAWEPKATYRPRFPFYKIGTGKAKAVIARNMKRSMDKALRSAK